MLQVNQLVGFGSGGGALPATASFITSYNTTANASTYTIAASDFGSPTLEAGKLVFTLSGRGGAASWNTPTGVTESGDALTKISAQVSGYNGAAIYQLHGRGAGALGEVIFTFGAEMGAIIVGLYMITGEVASGVSAIRESTASPLSGGPVIPAKGVAIGVGETENAATATWVNLTENYDVTNANTIGSGASVTDESGSTPTITCTWTSSANPAMCLASWGPPSTTAGTVTFKEVVSSSANQASYTFSSADIGTAGATRVVVLYVGVWNDGGSAITVTGVTVGGAAASRQAQYVGHSSGGSKFELWTCAVASGTSADIIVSTSSGGVVCPMCQVGIWDCKGILTTSCDTDGIHNTSTTSQSTTLSCPANGVIIMGGYSTQSAIGFTNITEDYDSSTHASANTEGSNYYSGASEAFGTDQVDRVVGMTTSSEQLWMVSASFGPSA